MRCRHCGHPADQHGDNGCRIRIVTGWDQTLQGFTGEHPCGCAGYAEPHRTHYSDCDCPHELCSDSICVHCGRNVAVEI
jgi:hypothetical protein